jgi:hypothetical protein
MWISSGPRQSRCRRFKGRTLRSRSWSDIGVAVDGCAAGCPGWRCRRGCTTLPPSRVSAAPGAGGCRCPPAASTVQASGPGAEPQQMSAEPDTADTAAAPEQGRDTVVAGRLSIHAHPPAAAVGTGRRLRTLPGCPLCVRTAATIQPSGRHRQVAAERVSGRLRNWTLQASAVHRCVRNHSRCPDGQCPPATPPSSVGVRGYRKRSPGRRPLVGRSHRRYARASWRRSRSPSWART